MHHFVLCGLLEIAFTAFSYHIMVKRFSRHFQGGRVRHVSKRLLVASSLVRDIPFFDLGIIRLSQRLVPRDPFGAHASQAEEQQAKKDVHDGQIDDHVVSRPHGDNGGDEEPRHTEDDHLSTRQEGRARELEASHSSKERQIGRQAEQVQHEDDTSVHAADARNDGEPRRESAMVKAKPAISLVNTKTFVAEKAMEIR